MTYLAEAFKFSAEHYIYFNEVEKAVRPYKQAIAITESGAQASKWHLELGSIYYRLIALGRSRKRVPSSRRFRCGLVRANMKARLFRASSLDIYEKVSPKRKKFLMRCQPMKTIQGLGRFLVGRKDAPLQTIR
jgi:hypothetical protein